MATDFHWPPDDVDHYLAMQGAVAHQVGPTRGEHTLIGERCGASKNSIIGWRKRHRIPALQPEPGSLAGCKKRGPKGYKRGFAGPSSLDVSAPPIGGMPHKEIPLLGRSEIAEIYDGRAYEDDPRAVEGRL